MLLYAHVIVFAIRHVNNENANLQQTALFQLDLQSNHVSAPSKNVAILAILANPPVRAGVAKHPDAGGVSGHAAHGV